MKRTLVLIFIFLAILFAIFYELNSATINPSIKVISAAIEEGYKVKPIGSGKYQVFNICDTLFIDKTAYTKKEWELIKSFYSAWKPSYASLKRNIKSKIISNTTPITQKVYFVAREDRLLQSASIGLYGLDTSKVMRARRSMTQSQNQYWRVLRMRINPADSTRLINNLNIHYLVPYKCTMDKLRDYLNNPESKPMWTEKENLR